MTKEQFGREMHYQVTLAIFRSMVKKRLINKKEYAEIEKILLAEYKPLMGALYVKKP